MGWYGAAGWGLTVAVFAGVGGGLAAAPQKVEYLRQVKPVLTERCIACHGVLQQQGGLRLDTAAFALKGGRSGPAVKPGRPDLSPLIRRVTAPEHGGRMPPEGEPLKAEEIRALQEWILQKAPVPAGEKPEQHPRDHWSFRPIRRPQVPGITAAPAAAANPARTTRAARGSRPMRPATKAPAPRSQPAAAWGRNPIDAFLAREHRRYGLKPQPEAPRSVLIRRLYVDLIGLPPTPEELAQVEGDTDPGWYERLVDRLLADPRHGERWARHWMDIWRYSDWWGLGDQVRNSQPNIWHWRDWLIESLNADLPYDEMVRQMLAADELYPNDLPRLRATGYLARNWYLFNRHQWMEETVEHVSKGLLGLTMNCAKCHDHKYDPIQQADFYRLRAFFEPYHVRVDAVPGEPDPARSGIPRAYDAELETPTYLFVRGQETRPDKSQPISPGVPALLAFKPLQAQPIQLPAEAWQPERRAWVGEAHRAAATRRLKEAEQALAAAGKAEGAAVRRAELTLTLRRAELERVNRVIAAMQAAWSLADAAAPAPALRQAEEEARRAAVQAERAEAAARAKLAQFEAEERLRTAAAEQRAAREKEAAQARVAAEQAAARAGAPIAATEKFTPLVGAQWAATRFQFSGKDDPTLPFPPRSTGRRTALAGWITDRRNPLTARVAVNHLWTRHFGTPLVPTVFDFGRKGTPPTHPELLDWLAAEFMEKGWSMRSMHRLIVTSAAYRMSSSQRGAAANLARDRDNRWLWRREPIRLEAEVLRDSLLTLAGRLDTTTGGPPVPAGEQAASRRRSLYFFHSDTDRNLFLTTFDGAAVRECYRREQSIIPQQALAMANSSLVLDAAAPIAARLARGNGEGAPAPDDDAFIRRAFAVLLAHTPSDAEMAACRRAMAAWRTQGPAGSERTHLVWTLINHNDFVTLR